jgi:hypothetical protein
MESGIADAALQGASRTRQLEILRRSRFGAIVFCYEIYTNLPDTPVTNSYMGGSETKSKVLLVFFQKKRLQGVAKLYRIYGNVFPAGCVSAEALATYRGVALVRRLNEETRTRWFSKGWKNSRPLA